MSKRVATLTSLLALVMTSLAHAQDVDRRSELLSRRSRAHTNVPPGKIEVAEIFSYACPFCAQFNPLVKQLQNRCRRMRRWYLFQPRSIRPRLADVPTGDVRGADPGNPRQDATTRCLMPCGRQANSPSATRNPQAENPLPTIEAVARVLQPHQRRSRSQFLDTAKSFGVDTQMRRDDALIVAYHIDGTPSLIVNGKYRISGQSAGGMPQMIEVAKCSWRRNRRSRRK